MAEALQETDPTTRITEKAARELEIADELLAHNALELAPCKPRELLESVRQQLEDKHIVPEIGSIAMWNLVNRGELLLDTHFTIQLGEELQIIANTRNNIEHLI